MVLYFLGPVEPKPEIDPTLPSVESDMEMLEAEIQQSENSTPNLKSDNHARIVWHNAAVRQKTRFALVYLHGLSGSQADGFPIHLDFARRYGCNLYLSRLADHGVDSEDALQELTLGRLLESAKRAVSIGKQIGDQVIIMATSTGAALALIIAAHHHDLAGLILYSPNIDFYDKGSEFLKLPWGLYLARLLQQSYYVEHDDPPEVRQYWQSKYRLEALVAVKSLLSHTMTNETFLSIHQPVFVGYYFKNEDEQDKRA